MWLCDSSTQFQPQPVLLHTPTSPNPGLIQGIIEKSPGFTSYSFSRFKIHETFIRHEKLNNNIQGKMGWEWSWWLEHFNMNTSNAHVRWLLAFIKSIKFQINSKWSFLKGNKFLNILVNISSLHWNWFIWL